MPRQSRSPTTWSGCSCTGGAGKRLAAKVQPFPLLLQTLMSDPIKEAMVNLRDPHGHLDGEQVRAALSIINGGMVTCEQTGLYSQKTLMLIAGAGPCLDCQVRKGLRRLNLRGFTSPYVASLVLPMILAADRWSRDQSAAIAAAARQDQTVSQIVQLQSPARLIDIMLFTGGRNVQ
jgi:hypothetical protein